MRRVVDLGFGKVVVHNILTRGETEHAEACPMCRGYRLESSWCHHCNGSGIVIVKDNKGDTAIAGGAK